VKILKGKEMAQLDKVTVEKIGIPSLVLMENAARGLLEVVKEKFSVLRRVLVVAGKGNNGGDGIALARMLYLQGLQVDLFLPLGNPKGDALRQLEILKNLGLNPLRDNPSWEDYDLIVDSLFGTGFEPPVKGKAVQIIKEINSTDIPVLSVDIPSGLSADSGRVFEPCIKASVTVTFQFLKVCHVLFPSAKFCGEVVVKDISIPSYLADSIKRETIEEVDVPRREPDTYKTKEGHVLIVGGSTGKTGAVIMAALAASRTGSGLVSVGIPQDLNTVFESRLVEEMSIPLKGRGRLSYFAVEEILSLQEKFSALAVGMGMDRYEEGQDIIRELILNWNKPLLIDADGINNLADLKDLSLLKKRQGITVLTPHVGEFSRLSGLSHEYVTSEQLDVASEFSTEYNCYLVLKSARTAVATPEGKVYLSTRGTPAMAKGGTGDVLSGILIALLGKGLDPEKALKLGVVLHGIAGEIAEKETHMESLKALDIVECIPHAYKKIQSVLENPR